MRKDDLKANTTSKKTTKIKRGIRLEPPQSGLLKNNFDGSVVDSKAAAGFIIRNEDGTLIIALKDAFWRKEIISRSFFT
ncbi:hypothetical protein DVH24_041513 [Malus domestica]|uniref:Uncharacterized protein n=1 Tax=Malus domestica TaxID=3750 RepID=A0A498IA97_MALDO|nr:hypothetical protein DVH24_041513 [Malus domestica]